MLKDIILRKMAMTVPGAQSMRDILLEFRKLTAAGKALSPTQQNVVRNIKAHVAGGGSLAGQYPSVTAAAPGISFYPKAAPVAGKAVPGLRGALATRTQSAVNAMQNMPSARGRVVAPGIRVAR